MTVHLDDDERRRRFVVRHHLRRDAHDVADVVRSEVALHSSDPVTPFLACWARIPGFAVADLERALYEQGSARRMHTMRRTLWVVPAGHVGRHQVAFADKVWRAERAKLLRWLQDDGLDDPESLLYRLEAQVEEVLGEGPRSTRSLGDLVDGLDHRTRGGSTSLASKVPFLLALQGRLVRGRPLGTWRSSQYEWVAARTIPGAAPDRPEPPEARAAFARHWLAAFGPARREDVAWFTKWTVAEVRDALREVGAVEVDLEGGRSGVVLPEDLDLTPDPGESVSLLPGLDPTIMAWKDRSWFVDDDGDLFDDNGNAGPVVVVDGRVVGGWGQDPDGVVVTDLLDPGAASIVAAEADRLTTWLDGTVVSHRFPSGVSRRLMDHGSR